MKFAFFGIKIYISFLFLSIITIMIFIDKSGLILPMLLSVFLHEIAHITVMVLLKSKIKEINLIPCSLEIVRDSSQLSIYEILISISGPLINLILCAVFLKNRPLFAAINFCYGAFNLLPLTTLDGGEILKIILSRRFSEEKISLILKCFNLTFGLFGLIFGILIFLENQLNLTLIIFSLYIIILNIIKI